MNDILKVHVKSGYKVNDINSASFNTITIEPEVLNYYVFEDFRSNFDVPIDVIKEMASEEIAKNIVNKLTYRKDEKYDGTIVHYFSIKDYTIKESAEKEQIINNLTNDYNNLTKDYSELTTMYYKLIDRYDILNEVYRYNSRNIFEKIIDWVLYDKVFNKKKEI